MGVRPVRMTRVFSWVLIAACVAEPATAGGAFHAPTTDAERALDYALRISDADGRILDNLFDRYPDSPVPRGKRVDYGRLLAPDFLASLKREEQALVQKECGGVYQKGEECGMDANPITCIQDVLSSFPNAFLYSTIRSGAGRVTIAIPAGNHYAMVLTTAGWRLGGVTCNQP